MGKPQRTIFLQFVAGSVMAALHAAESRSAARTLRRHLAIFLFIAAAEIAHAQISPGPLARAHQQLNGPANCTKCHQFSTSTPTFRCVECHREIADEIQQNRGLHATFPRSGAEGTSCVKCHSDHNGEDFTLIHWDPKNFDHAKTSYALDGKHTGVECRACHSAQHISTAARALLGSKDLNHTWLGLSSSCATCHQDAHQGRLGNNCAQCHSTSDWHAAKVEQQGFDHSRTQFPLTGEHRYVLCKSCHTPGADGQPRYAGLPFAYCADCHRDPHKGEFKQGCDSCHTTLTWKKSTFTATFDHSKTAFPLLGKHLEVPCVSCHEGGDFKAPIAHNACADCHTPDPHGGQFMKRADGGRCESCHTVAGWSPSSFTLADHAKTGFPLVAPHAKVSCAQCHIPAGQNTRYKIKFAACVDCHKDEHHGQFAGEPWRNRCEECHTGLTFATTSYTLAKHQISSFPLTGGHMAVACNDCHKPASGSQVALYHFSPLGCTSCHEDVHQGQFAGRMAVSGASGKPLGCEACHSTKEWTDLSRFDHAQTRFPLEGSHRAVACADCHKPPNMELNLMHVKFGAASTSCSDCHENPHGGQFGTRGNDCASCHNSNKWQPSLFDHEKTAFSLKGAHQDVACSACHTLKKQVNGEPVLFYKPTPTACDACHGSDIPKTPDPRQKQSRNAVQSMPKYTFL
jgi:hypothetical protein